MPRRFASAMLSISGLLMSTALLAQQPPANPPGAAPAEQPPAAMEQKPEVQRSAVRGSPEASGGTPQDSPFVVLPGYQVELVYSVPRAQLGSWVALTVDPKGRIIASDEGRQGLSRVTPGAVGTDEPLKVEKLDLDINSVQGLLFAFDALYCSVNNQQTSGLYRFKYDAAADTFGPKETLHRLSGAGEHGPHALRLSPDGKSIYMLCGNHTQPPYQRELSAPVSEMGGAREQPLHATLQPGNSSRLPPNWDEDLILPREWDANGHARGIMAPGGWVAKTDPDGKTWEILASGMRNTYDMGLNAEGEMFLYDADMEWDLGSPWYRPTRLLHATSGAEFGWRSGTAKWPEYYADSLPSIVQFGPGSPVGVTFGYGAKFPGKYQKAMYCCDWTFGTMYAIHITPDGASYKGEKEEFLSRNALGLTDVVIGADGAMYFTIGGRGAEAFMYRVTYKGDESTAPVDPIDPQFADMRKLRRQIESTHMNGTAETGQRWQDATGGDTSVAARVKYLLPFLAHEDRHIRYAARLGLESIPVAEWRSQALGLTDPMAKIEGMMALARQGEKSDQQAILNVLAGFNAAQLPEAVLLPWLRAVELAFIRLGAPGELESAAWVAKLNPLYPHESLNANRELVQLLVFLKAPDAVEKTVALLEKPTPIPEQELAGLIARNARYGGTVRRMLENHPDQQRLHYAFVLRNAREGWSMDSLTKYFTFVQNAREWSGGATFSRMLQNTERQTFDGLSENQKLLVTASGVRQPYVAPELPKATGPERVWTMEQVREIARTQLKDRDFANGEQMFAAARCVVCHRFAGDGGATGPDLTQLAARFSIDTLTEAIFEPNRAISDQYRAHQIQTKGGQVINGRVVSEHGDELTIITDPEDPTKLVTIKRSEVEAMKPSDVSLMPANLLNPLNENEVANLMAYLLSKGEATNEMFTQPPPGQRRGRRGGGGGLGGGRGGGRGQGAGGPGGGRGAGGRRGAGGAGGAPGGAGGGAPGGAGGQ